MPELIDILVHLHHETKIGQDYEGAILVSTDGENSNAVWIPKSQVEIELTKTPGQRLLTMPDYVAVDKGLI